MQGLRLSLLVITLIAGFSAASFWHTCPTRSSGETDIYGRNNNSTEVRTGANTYCTCNGGTVTNAATTTATCTPAAVKPPCATISGCARSYIRCVDDLALSVANTSSCFTPLVLVRTAALALSAGQAYNESIMYRACHAWTCHTFNDTAIANCTLPYDYVCQTPVHFTFQIKLLGDFTKILANASAKAELITCIQADLASYLGFPTNVTAVTASAEPGLLVDAVAAVSKENPILKARLASLTPTNKAWLVCLTQAKFASLGGNGTLSFGGPVTPAPPPTPSPPPGATPIPTTPSPRSGASSLTWTLAQALVAIVAVLVMA
jgi:hypothetical protein